MAMKLWPLPLLVFLAACSRSPEEAQKKLAEIQVPQTAAALIAKTKDAKDEEVARMLVQVGVDPNARQENGMTVLMSAAFNGQHDVVRALLEKGAQVNADAKGFNALSLAVERNDKAMVQLLLANGAQARTRPGGGLSALEKAQQARNAELSALLEKAAQ
jgi:ankyrin repeat protein